MLDLFAGTGQLGIEALSRGAQRAVFVDRRTDAVKLIRENLALTRLEDGAQVVCGDSMAYLNALREKFDLIFLDPPYADDLLERAVAHIARFDILAPDGIMIAESPAEKELPKLSAPYRVARASTATAGSRSRFTAAMGRRRHERGTHRRVSRQLRPRDARPHGYHRARGAALLTACTSPSCQTAKKTHPMFTDEEKLELMRVSVAPLGNVEAALWNGLLTDFAAQKGARFLVRGARNSMDFDAEYQLSLIYKDVSGGALDTVLLCAEPAHQHISSTMAREMVKYHQPLEKYLPAAAAARIRGKDRG